jgi:hypothetical protein
MAFGCSWEWWWTGDDETGVKEDGVTIVFWCFTRPLLVLVGTQVTSVAYSFLSLVVEIALGMMNVERQEAGQIWTMVWQTG